MTAYFLLAVAVSAGITYLLRALPFLLFHGKQRMPDWLMRLGAVLPSAIMAVLIVYCLRGARGDALHTGLPGLIAVAVTGLSYLLKHKTLPSIVLGTAVYMILIRVI